MRLLNRQAHCINGKLDNQYFVMKNMERFLNKVINGDCLELMKDIPDKSIDMILCDLPYG